jgi:hypothetical protein
MFKSLAAPLVILASCCAGSAFAQDANQDLANYRAPNFFPQSPLLSPPPPLLVDARGRVAGRYAPDSNTAILNINGVSIVADVTNQTGIIVPYSDQGDQSGSLYKWTAAQQTWFLSTDCSGPPIPVAFRGLRPVAYVQDANTGAVTAYIGSAGKSKLLPAQSYKQPSIGAGSQPACVRQIPARSRIQGFDIEQTVNITQLYPESLSVR